MFLPLGSSCQSQKVSSLKCIHLRGCIAEQTVFCGMLACSFHPSFLPFDSLHFPIMAFESLSARHKAQP